MPKEELEFNEEGNKNKTVMILIIVIVVILLGAGGAIGYLWLAKQDASQEAIDAANQAKSDAHNAQPPVFYEIEQPFVVNYLVKERQRYLQVSVAFQMRDKKLSEFLKAHEPSLKNIINKILSTQDFEFIRTLPGKEELRATLKDEINKFITAESEHSFGVGEILYTNFVMQ